MSYNNVEYKAIKNIDAKHRPGIEFERMVTNGFMSIYGEKMMTNTIGTDLDKKQGTDFIFHNGVNDDIHIDATLDFDSKDNMILKSDTNINAIDMPAVTFNIGIRTANSHNGYTEFEKPVVVIGLDCDVKTYRQHEDIIYERFNENIWNLSDLIINKYDAYKNMINSRQASISSLGIGFDKNISEPDDDYNKH